MRNGNARAHENAGRISNNKIYQICTESEKRIVQANRTVDPRTNRALTLERVMGEDGSEECFGWIQLVLQANGLVLRENLTEYKNSW